MTIAEVSRTYDLSADTLRYYERIGLIPPVHRSAGGIREYDEEDCRWIEFIKCMRGAGLPIESLVEYVALFQQGEEPAPLPLQQAAADLRQGGPQVPHGEDGLQLVVLQVGVVAVAVFTHHLGGEDALPVVVD